MNEHLMGKKVKLNINKLERYLDQLTLSYDSILDILPENYDDSVDDLIDVLYNTWDVSDMYLEEAIVLGEEPGIKNNEFCILTSRINEDIVIRVPSYLLEV